MLIWIKEQLQSLRRNHEKAAASQAAFLIVGLGNPGPKYAHNRHNIGFLCIDYIAQTHGIELDRRRFKARFGKGRIAGTNVWLAKPLTYMNESGQAVGTLTRHYKIVPDHVIVIHDDLDLPFARLRIRPEGSSGGHRGVASVIAHLKTDAFPRVRIGIGRPKHGDPVDYVLSDFDNDQIPVLPRIYEQVNRVIQTILTDGVEVAMNAYNGLPSLAAMPEPTAYLP